MTMSKERTLTVPEYEKNKILRRAAIGLAFLIVFLSLPSLCFGHGPGHDHDHHHHEEPASFKWSRQANEVYEEEVHHHHHHHHSHEHAHDHGHEHAHEHAHTHEHTGQKVPQGKLLLT